jgi:hypothetical protein
MSMIASPTAIRPATWAVDAGVSADTGDTSDTGAVSRLLGCVSADAPGLAPGNAVMAGKSWAALPAPMSTLAAPFRLGMGPSGSVPRSLIPAGSPVGESAADAEADAEADADAEAEVTAVVSAAAGGVHFEVVATVAVTVSFTEATEVAFDATATLAPRVTGCLSVTDAMLHEAVPSSLAQPLLNLGRTLDGCAASPTVTPDADPFFVETCTT